MASEHEWAGRVPLDTRAAWSDMHTSANRLDLHDNTCIGHQNEIHHRPIVLHAPVRVRVDPVGASQKPLLRYRVDRVDPLAPPCLALTKNEPRGLQPSRHQTKSLTKGPPERVPTL